MRIGLRARIDAEPDMEVVAEAGDGPAAIAAYAAHKPDITLLDLRLPGMDGPQIITVIRQDDPGAKIIILTTYDADEDVYRAVQAGRPRLSAEGDLRRGDPGGASATSTPAAA